MNKWPQYVQSRLFYNFKLRGQAKDYHSMKGIKINPKTNPLLYDLSDGVLGSRVNWENQF